VCTLTIIPLRVGPEGETRGYRLVTNRDEGRSRPPAAPPRAHRVGAIRALWPVDALAGGSWVGVGDHGLALSILNVNLNPAPDLPRRDQLTSRGHIIPALIESATAREAIDRLSHEFELDRFAPFRLVAVDRDRILDARWDRESLEVDARPDHFACYVSSGMGDHLMTPRLDLFDRMLRVDEAIAQTQDDFHAHHWPDRPEVSVLMSREDASTVSKTTIEVRFDEDETSVHMTYTDAVGEHAADPAVGEVERALTSADRAPC